MKFKREAWRTLQPPPFHEGEYEVKLDTGEVIRALELNPDRLDTVDTQWIEHFLASPLLSKDKVEARHHKADAFFQQAWRPSRERLTPIAFTVSHSASNKPHGPF